jgi:hypothetical protein
VKEYYRIAYRRGGGGRAILPGLYLNTIQFLEDDFHGKQAVYRDLIKCTTLYLFGTA